MPSKKKNKKNKNKNNHDQAENPEIKGDKEIKNESDNIDQQDENYKDSSLDASEDKKQEVNKVVARIFGEDFCIKGDLSEEDIKKIAELVDYKMTEIFEKHPTLSSQKIAVLAALNIAEEYLRLEKDHKELLALVDERDLANGS
ncbi:cell division protein ZapA [Natranaerofaba carboxydovora]|uniref:cell division protein ZapA n=1 Tax=Natranaerofaba carboxydovora TaxID=2742683 RepID=UPI001F13C6AA|nr:cell division protein ZapA [Natranaerofaba carboxydovora]UMZ74043.1 Cell division protein ZapA [Natranaerofaba carboxydovora]